ncbi:hypothetical protein OC835_002762 [Tilletia horrida]|nr:hypothetical protein OC835_002762 [Tilletia horrida]
MAGDVLGNSNSERRPHAMSVLIAHCPALSTLFILILTLNLSLFISPSLAAPLHASATYSSSAYGSPSSSSYQPVGNHTPPAAPQLAHPDFSPQLRAILNVSNAIPYDFILRTYVAAKGQGPQNQCNKIEKRVEWRQLTDEERSGWISANWCLTKRPSVLAGTQTNIVGRHTSLYDDFTLVHVRLFYVIHHVAAFFPWHRLFLKARELALRECGYEGRIPYWNTAVDADTGNIQASPVLSNEFGIGGNGTDTNGTVTTGPFAYLPTSYLNRGSNASVPTFEPHFLTRTFGTVQAPNATFPMFEEGFNSSTIQRVFETAASNFSEFFVLVEGLRNRLDVVGAGPHGAVHIAIGGEMANPHSPNDVAFFLHHANVDRLWWLWQRGSTNGRDLPVNHDAAAWDLNSRFWRYTGNTLEYIIDANGGPKASLFDLQTVEGLFLNNIETYKLMDTTRPPLCYASLSLTLAPLLLIKILLALLPPTSAFSVGPIDFGSDLDPSFNGPALDHFPRITGLQSAGNEILGSDIEYGAAVRQYFDATSGPKRGCQSLRPRVEWRALTPQERKGWIQAVWCLAKRPSVLTSTQTNLTGLHTSLLSDFTLVHIRLFQTIHFVAAFLPWHRWYLIARDVAMRGCGYDGRTPYWDWSIDADKGSLADSPVLSDDRGVGGNGNSLLRGVVTSGPFARLPLEYVNVRPQSEIVPTYSPHFFNRTFGSGFAPNRTHPLQEDAYTTSTVQKVLLTSTKYSDFQPRLEGLRGRLDSVGMGPHTAIHRALGGDMPFPHSANDPAFFLHHANVDRLWWLWQLGLSLKDTRRFGSSKAEKYGTRVLRRGRGDDDIELDQDRLYAFDGNTIEYRNDSTGGSPASLNDVQSLLGLLLPNIPTYQLMDASRPPLCYYYI